MKKKGYAFRPPSLLPPFSSLPFSFQFTLSSNESEERVLSSSPVASGAKSASVRRGGGAVVAACWYCLREAAAFAVASDAASAFAALSLDCLLVVTLHAAYEEEDPGVVSEAEKALPNGEGSAPRTQFGVAALAAVSAPMHFSPRSLLAGGVALGIAVAVTAACCC